MAHTIKGMTSRKTMALNYGVSDKTFRNRLRLYFKNTFDGVRLFTAGQVAQIVEVLGHWEATIED